MCAWIREQRCEKCEAKICNGCADGGACEAKFKKIGDKLICATACKICEANACIATSYGECFKCYEKYIGGLPLRVAPATEETRFIVKTDNLVITATKKSESVITINLNTHLFERRPVRFEFEMHLVGANYEFATQGIIAKGASNDVYLEAGQNLWNLLFEFQEGCRTSLRARYRNATGDWTIIVEAF